jgi:hypothetical protein
MSLLPSKPRQFSNNVYTNTLNTLVTDDSGVYITDTNNGNTNISLKTNNKTGLFINNDQRIGINTELLTNKRFVINDELGQLLRLIYDRNTTNRYVDIDINSQGSLLIKTNSNQYIDFINESNNLATNIKLNGNILYATANQLNYNAINTIGVAESNKALILDNNKNIRGINELYVNTIYATTFGIYDNLILDRDTFNYSLLLANRYGKCLKLQNDTNFTLFDMETNGILKIYNNQNIIEIIGDNNNNIIYPLQYTTLNNNNNTGIGIKFNTYNNNNNKVSMSSIETIITNNQNNLENSIIRFNNRNDGILTNTVTIRNDGYILCNTLMELSDLRTKNIIKKSNSIDSLNKICQINTYDFVYKNDNTKKIHKGIIAQEIYEIIPSAINIESNNEFTNLYTISNKELIGYLIDAIKELKYQIDIIQ